MDKAEIEIRTAEEEIRKLRRDKKGSYLEFIKYYEGFIHGIKAMQQYAQQVSREVAVRFMTELDDTFDEETPFKDRLNQWGELFDEWKKQK